MEYIKLMNNTKWEELRLGMYGLADQKPAWRTRCIENGYISQWDREWFYHFRECGYEIIEWVEIKTESPEQEAIVQEVLSKIHVPGEKIGNLFKVYGHIPIGQAVDYI